MVSKCDVREHCSADDGGDEVKSRGSVSSFCKALSVCARTLQSRWCVSHNASPSDASGETEHAEGMCQQCVDVDVGNHHLLGNAGFGADVG